MKISIGYKNLSVKGKRAVEKHCRSLLWVMDVKTMDIEDIHDIYGFLGQVRLELRNEITERAKRV